MTSGRVSSMARARRKSEFPSGAKYDKQLKDGEQVASARYQADLRSVAEEIVEEKKDDPDAEVQDLIHQAADSAVIYTKHALDILVESNNWTAASDEGQDYPQGDVSQAIGVMAYFAYAQDLQEMVGAVAEEMGVEY